MNDRIELVFFIETFGDYVAIYRRRIDGRWHFNFTHNRKHKNLRDVFPTLSAYGKIQTNSEWHDSLDDAMCSIDDFPWINFAEPFAHSDHCDEIHKEFLWRLRFLKNTWAYSIKMSHRPKLRLISGGKR